jgi:hypothetical protein
MNSLMTITLSYLLTFFLIGCHSLSNLAQTEFYRWAKPANSPVANQQQTDQSPYDRSRAKLKEGREMLNSEQIISAQVLLVAATGERIDGNTLITAQNIDNYRPSESTVQAVSQYFRNHNFEVYSPVGISFTISASAKHFSEFFKVSITQDKSGRILTGNRLELPLNSLEKNIADSVTSVIFVPPPDFGPTNFSF